MTEDTLRQRARDWADHDPDPVTAAALSAAIDADDLDELELAAGEDITFGTAGLRAEVGPGPARMNLAVVRRATAGLASHLAATADAEAVVCVGFDARPDSERFAIEAVGVLLAAGRSVVFFETATPTPVVAWAARETGAAGAIVVTASHNPPADNGYKVYDGDAKQITPPTDVAIAEAIAGAPPADEIPVAPLDGAGDRLERVGRFARRRYLDQVVELVDAPGPRGDVTFVHTSLHGVGSSLVLEALRRTGVTDVHPVPEQQEPDGTFPTVSFPNPEEPGALDLAFALADDVGAGVVLANDPDTDRLAVALREDSGWRRLSGNEVAAVLADDLLSRAPERGLVATSIVTSPWVGEVAARHGARYEQTLTGFKWIWHAMLALRRDGWVPVLGAEEALGYCVGQVVRDKDGISGAAVVADLVRRLAAEGRTLGDELDRLRGLDGTWVAAQVSVVRDGPDGPGAIAQAMRVARDTAPTVLAGIAVTDVVDHLVPREGVPEWLPPSDLVELHLDGGRALVRPSGTEPKLKVYVDLQLPGDADPAEGRALAEAAGRDWVTQLGL